MAAPSLKVDIPIPAGNDSRAFTAALKVCLAAAAFGVPLQYSTGKARNLVYVSGIALIFTNFDFQLPVSRMLHWNPLETTNLLLNPIRSYAILRT
jgi:hypothetical protein